MPKNTIATTARCDARTLATILMFCREKGEHPQSASQLIGMGLEMMALIIKRRQPELTFDKTDEAAQYLKKCGVMDPFRQGKRNVKSLIEQIELEDLDMDGFSGAGHMESRHKRGFDHAIQSAIEKQMREKEAEDYCKIQKEMEKGEE